MKIKFREIRIKNQPAVAEIIRLYNVAFEVFCKNHSTMSEEGTAQATDIKTNDAPANQFLKKYGGSFIAELLLGNKVEIYTLSREEFTLDDESYVYFDNLAPELRAKFILSSTLEECREYSETSNSLPEGKAGALLLIEELIKRLFARILSDNSNFIAKHLIGSLLNVFINQLNNMSDQNKIDSYGNPPIFN